jgi:hypothetical protein
MNLQIMNPCSWWYYFDKLSGNRASCKHCDWIRDRGKAQATNILQNQLAKQHKDQYQKKLDAEQAKTEQLKKQKEDLEKKRTFFKPTITGEDIPPKTEGPGPAKVPKLSEPAKMFPIFGEIYRIFCFIRDFKNLGSWRTGGDCAERLEQLMLKKFAWIWMPFQSWKKKVFAGFLNF